MGEKLAIAGLACNVSRMPRPFICSVLTSCLFALPAPALANVEPVAATPANSPGSWVLADDYPPVALRARAEGTTGFQLSIDEQGAVAGCQIVKSSGFADLDVATCALLTKRARFNPATDQDGRPAKGSFRSRIMWVIPRTHYQMPASGSMVRQMIVEANGQLSHCKTSGAQVGGTQLVNSPCPDVFYIPYRDSAGKPVRKIVTITSSTTVTDVPN